MQSIIFAASIFLFSQATSQASPLQPSQQAPQALSGCWYMGTLSGMDCDLQFNSNGTIDVQFGGCFNFDLVISSSWEWEDGKIKIMNKELVKKFGRFLFVHNNNDKIFLVPEINSDLVKKHGFTRPNCFWKMSDLPSHKFRTRK